MPKPTTSVNELPALLADANCRGAADVQKKAKAAWKAAAPPALFELVKKTFRMKSMDFEVSEQLEQLEQAVVAAKLSFDVTALARAIYDRSKHATPPLGTAYLLPRDAAIAREFLETCLNRETKTLEVTVSLATLPDTFFDALPHLQPVESLEVSVDNLTSHRLSELSGLRRIWLSLGSNTTLPTELFHDGLIWLTVRSKKLVEIPEEIGRARNAWMIDIDAPKVKKLPKALDTLPIRTLSLAVTLPKLDVSIWPELRFLYLNGSIKKIDGLEKLPELEDYKQRCGAKFPEAIWNVPKLKQVWIWFDGFDDFDEVKAKFEARGVEVTR